MHVAVAETALSVVRSIRCASESNNTSFWFPAVSQSERRVYLQTEACYDSASCDSQSKNSDADLFQESLEDIAFPFDAVVSNKSVDFSCIDGPISFSRSDSIELGVFDRIRRENRKTLKSLLLNRRLPARALVPAGHNLHFASPELIVIQLARRLDCIDLAQIIMEFAGTYSLPPSSADAAQETVFEIEPVTSIARIRELAKRMPRIQHRDVLNSALELAKEGSASAPESQLATVLHLPMCEGGYERRALQLNPVFEAPESAREYLGQGTFFPDIFIQDCFTDIEYQSTSFHLDPLTASWTSRGFNIEREAAKYKTAKDMRRMRDLQAMGIHVIPVTQDDLNDCSQLDAVAWSLAQQRERILGESSVRYMEELNRYEHRSAREALLERFKAKRRKNRAGMSIRYAYNL